MVRWQELWQCRSSQNSVGWLNMNTEEAGEVEDEEEGQVMLHNTISLVQVPLFLLPLCLVHKSIGDERRNCHFCDPTSTTTEKSCHSQAFIFE